MIHPWIQSHGDHPHVGENPPYMSGGGEDHSSTKIRRNFNLNLGVFLWRGGLRLLFVDHFSKKKKTIIINANTFNPNRSGFGKNAFNLFSYMKSTTVRL